MSQNMVSPVASVGALDASRATAGTSDLGHVGVAHALLSNTEMDRVLLASPFSMTQAKIDRLTVNDKQNKIIQAVKNSVVDTVDLLPPLHAEAGAPTSEVHPYGTVWHNTGTGDIYQTPGDGTWTQLV